MDVFHLNLNPEPHPHPKTDLSDFKKDYLKNKIIISLLRIRKTEKLVKFSAIFTISLAQFIFNIIKISYRAPTSKTVSSE